MKPLFDSEIFSFIGAADDQIYVHCRKCGKLANVEVAVSDRGFASVTASCKDCNSRKIFQFVNGIAATTASGMHS